MSKKAATAKISLKNASPFADNYNFYNDYNNSISIRTQFFLTLSSLILIFLALIAFSLDLAKVRPILNQTNWAIIPIVILLTILSHLYLSIGFAFVGRIFNQEADFFALFRIAFTSVALSHFLPLGGVSEYSLRILFAKVLKIRVSDLLSTSLFHTFLNLISILILLPAGMFLVLSNIEVSHPLYRLMLVSIASLILLMVLTILVILNHPFRLLMLKLAEKIGKFVLRRNIQAGVWYLDEVLTIGARALRKRPHEFIPPLFLTLIDWLAGILAVWFCLLALGVKANLGAVTIGLIIGTNIGFISMAPGGLGIQEGSIAALFSLLGIPFTQGLLSSILFRLTFQLPPFVIGLISYWRIFRQAEK